MGEGIFLACVYEDIPNIWGCSNSPWSVSVVWISVSLVVWILAIQWKLFLELGMRENLSSPVYSDQLYMALTWGRARTHSSAAWGSFYSCSHFQAAWNSPGLLISAPLCLLSPIVALSRINRSLPLPLAEPQAQQTLLWILYRPVSLPILVQDRIGLPSPMQQK